MPAEIISAPWTSEQVQALNDYQERGQMHPFTCGGGPHRLGRSPLLDAAHSGWICPDPDCDYTQDWAWDFMATPAP
ncbi:hypothetical protein [Streptomyces sp. NPDC001268]|uniref:hypothetical protein n=1 Tax=Streptomyces sp. NPDC001268 TaxID=3364553 RepID=UPI00367B388B